MDERKKLPLLPILLGIALALFLQVGKESVRAAYWYGSGESGILDRASAWLEQSRDRWDAALDDPTGTMARDLAARSQSRVALLNNTTSVLVLTPEVVPHQGLSLYSYLSVTFIPRFVWPDKPSISEANRFYQVTYGLTEESRLGDVSIAVGVLTEGYVAFGWLGVLVAMYLLGVVLDVFRFLLLRPASGLLAQGIGFALIPHFLSIEAQVAAYVGGLPQQILVTLLVLSPVVWLNALPSRQPQPGTEPYRPWPLRVPRASRGSGLG